MFFKRPMVFRRLQRLWKMSEEPKVEWVSLRKGSKKPEKATDGSGGYDVCASVVLDPQTRKKIGRLPREIKPGESILVGIGVAFEVHPSCCVAVISPRSSFEPKFDIRLGTAPGIIDPDFRGESTVFLINEGKKPFTVEKNMRIAQLVFGRVETPVWERVKSLSKTKRGKGGLGSTGNY